MRLWLLGPTESVVEPMASAVREVLDLHRNLAQHNTAKELVIRWNDPELCEADEMVDAVAVKMRTGQRRAVS